MNVDGEKIRQLIEHYGTQKKYEPKTKLRRFCEDFDLNYIQWSSYIKGTQNLGIKIIHVLMNIFPSLNLNWFLKDEGQMFTSEEKVLVLNEPKAEYSKKIEKEDLYEKLDEILVEIKKISIKK